MSYRPVLIALLTILLVQSAFAAKAVNEGRSDEMVWIASSNIDFEDWYAHALKRLNLELRAELTPWDLTTRLARRGVVKGYILYRYDTSPGETSEHRPGMDRSVNVATSMAGLLDGIIVDESLEPAAKAHGLKQLLDARLSNLRPRDPPSSRTGR